MAITKFKDKLQQQEFHLSRVDLQTVQINMGKLCNLACAHCHVDAGPNKKKENMNETTVRRIVELLSQENLSVRTVDLTGGAPELNPHFKYLVQTATKLGYHVIDRCNLTVLFEKGQEDTAEFLSDQGVEIVASLPCYSSENVTKQRGNGVFDKSIKALQMLNDLGYGKKKGLQLNLVYNPVGAVLPPDQKQLQDQYKEKLWNDFNISFNQLFTITNMPIKRFLFDLKRKGLEQEYWNILHDHFNASSLNGVMCRFLISISWDGKLYDCDFNQMLGLPILNSQKNIWDLKSFNDLEGIDIEVGNHCYGCTAGAGSSCTGSLT